MTQLRDSRTNLIDESHLDRQTMGDARLAGELLEMFLLQLDAAMRELATAGPQKRMAIAHSLKGTARSLGIATVAECAAALEAPLLDAAALDRLGHVATTLGAQVRGRVRSPG